MINAMKQINQHRGHRVPGDEDQAWLFWEASLR